MTWFPSWFKWPVCGWQRVFFGPTPEILQFDESDGDPAEISNRRVTRAEFFGIYDRASCVLLQGPYRFVYLRKHPTSGEHGYIIWNADGPKIETRFPSEGEIGNNKADVVLFDNVSSKPSVF